jgi:hypothetical protein
MTKYNINELLDKKKDLEKQLDNFKKVDTLELLYTKEVFTDHSNDDKTKTIEKRPKITFAEYTQKFNTTIEELRKINIAIQKHNANNVVELLQQRDEARAKIAYLDSIIMYLPRDRNHQRGVSRQHEGKIIESVEMITEPMFDIKEIEKQYNEAAALERKLNTNIQKINLNSEVEL